jgi:hypothetical protein
VGIPLEQVVLELTTEYKGVRQGLDEVIARLRNSKAAAKDATGGFGALEGQWKRMVTAFSAGTILTRAISGIVTFGQEAVATAGHVVDLADQTGLSTEAVQLYGAVAKRTGGDLNTYANAIFKLGVNLSDGASRTREALDELGLSWDNIRSKSPEDQFEIIAEALGQVTNAGDRNRLGVELMGKTYAGVAAGIVQGVKSIKDATSIVGEETLRAVDEASEALDQFFDNAKSALTDFLGELVLAFSSRQSALATIGGLLASGGTQAGLAIAAGRNITIANMPPKPPRGDKGSDKDKAAEAEVKRLQKLAEAEVKRLQKLAEAEVKRLQKELQDLADTLDGNRLYDEMTQLADAIELIGGMSGVSADQIDGILTKIEAFKRAGFALRPELKEIDAAFGGLTYAVMGLNDPTVLQRTRDLMKSLKDDLPEPDHILRLADGLRQMSDTIAHDDFFDHPIFGGSSGLFPGDHVELGPAPADLSAWNTYNRLVGIAGVSLSQIGSIAGESTRKWSSFAVQAVATLTSLIAWSKAATAAEVSRAAASSAAWAAATMGISLAITGAIMLYEAEKQARLQAQGLRNEWDQLGYSAAEVTRLVREAAIAQDVGVGHGGAIPAGIFDQVMEDAKKRSDQVTAAIDKMTERLRVFGGVAPQAMRPFIEDLLKSTHLTEDQRKALEGMLQKPKWEALQQEAQDLGVSLDALGSGFQQSKLNDLADGYAAFFKTATENGGDATGILSGMADEVQALIDNAAKFGLKLPEFMKPMLEQMIKNGQLMDPAKVRGYVNTLLQAGNLNDEQRKALQNLGPTATWEDLQAVARQMGITLNTSDLTNALKDLTNFSFDDIESAQDKMVDYLKEIRDILAVGQPTVAAPHSAVPRHGKSAVARAADSLLNMAGGGRRMSYAQIVAADMETPGAQSQPVVRQYTGNVELNIAGRRVGDVLIEDILRTFENNSGDGQPVGPTTRLSIALRRAA